MSSRANPSGAVIDRHIGARLRELRITRGLSQHDVAARLGVTDQQLHKYEQAFNRIPAARLYQCAVALNVSIDAFFEHFGEADPSRLRRERMALELSRITGGIAEPRYLAALVTLARLLAEAESGRKPAPRTVPQ